MDHNFVGFRLATLFNCGQISADTLIDVKPCIVRNYKEKPRTVFNWFEGSLCWGKLGSELARLFDEMDYASDMPLIDGKFYINAETRVTYKIKSKYRETSADLSEMDYGLECFIEQLEEREQFYNGQTSHKNVNEYEPQNSFAKYEQYTPSKKSNDSLESNGIIRNNDPDPYCPEPILSVSDPLPMPEYKPKRIASKPNAKKARPTNKPKDESQPKRITKPATKKRGSESDDFEITEPKNKRSRLKQPKGRSNNTNNSRTKTTTTTATTTRKRRSVSVGIASTELMKSQQEPQSSINVNATTGNSRLRSRSSSVNYRDQISKTKKKKVKETKVSELFGSDDDEDATQYASTSSSAPNSVKPTQPPTYLKPTSKAKIPTCSKYCADSIDAFKQLINNIRPPTPKKVDILLLTNITTEDVSRTFELYLSQISQVYQEMKNVTQCEFYKGINHVLFVGLIEKDIEHMMMDLLSDNFNLLPNHQCLKLILNALLPSWLLLIFMDQYKMNRDDAIRHLNEQQAYTDSLQTEDSTRSLMM